MTTPLKLRRVSACRTTSHHTHVRPKLGVLRLPHVVHGLQCHLTSPLFATLYVIYAHINQGRSDKSSVCDGRCCAQVIVLEKVKALLRDDDDDDDVLLDGPCTLMIVLIRGLLRASVCDARCCAQVIVLEKVKALLRGFAEGPQARRCEG